MGSQHPALALQLRSCLSYTMAATPNLTKAERVPGPHPPHYSIATSEWFLTYFSSNVQP